MFYIYLNIEFKKRNKFILLINLTAIFVSSFLAYRLAIKPSSNETWNEKVIATYAKPSIVNTSSQDSSRKFNLIWIFVESLETNYKSKSILKKLNDSTRFMTEFEISPLVQKYTIGAIMSERCGVPLFLGFLNGNDITSTAFNNTYCIDDILKANHYKSTFIVGHDARFSGLGDYFKTHADADVYDLAYFKKNNISSHDKNDHYSDEFIFDFALHKLNSISKSPFSMTILTLDNHTPTGIPSDKCKRDYGDNLEGVLTCNSDNLAKFINSLNESGILKNTALVVVGDHPFMGEHRIFSDVRSVYAKIYTPLDIKLKTKTVTPFDLFPTTLSAIGFKTGDSAYGLGFSRYETLFEPDPDWSMLLKDGFRGTPPDSYLALHKR